MVKVAFKVGDKVFAKVKGYPPWPARIEGDTGKKKYNVVFYGTLETGAVKHEDICYYLENKDNYVYKYLRRAGYEQAIKKIEEAISEDGGDGNEDTSDADNTEIPDIPNVSDKKALKRRVASLPDELSSQKKSIIRSRRRSESVVDLEDDSGEPAAKKPRRKSNSSSDNGLKPDIQEEDEEDVKSENTEEIDRGTVRTINVEKKKDGFLTKIVEDSPEKDESVLLKEKSESFEKTGKTPLKRNKEEEDSKKPKETEFIEIENNGDTSFHNEEEPLESEETEKSSEKADLRIEIVTEQSLKNNILYAEHVKKNPNLYKDKPIEPRQDKKDQVFPVKLPSGILCGIKLHKNWPLEHNNEHDRALYDEQVAISVLETRDLLCKKNKTLEEIEADVIPDLQMTIENVKEITYSREIESKKKRLDRLKKEADLVTWDSKIKNNLGLDTAKPDAAIDCLKEFNKIEKNIDFLMFKKHPHVLDTIRRLRKYVGNVNEWQMSSRDMDIFVKKAERIRNQAEKIYDKIRGLIGISDDKGTFWDSFMDVVSDFRLKCKDLSESEVLVLCAEPDSRQAFLDKLEEVSESEGSNVNTSKTSKPVLKETSVQGWTERK